MYRYFIIIIFFFANFILFGFFKRFFLSLTEWCLGVSGRDGLVVLVVLVVIVVVLLFLVYVRDVVGQRTTPRAGVRPQTMYGTPFFQVFERGLECSDDTQLQTHKHNTRVMRSVFFSGFR